MDSIIFLNDINDANRVHVGEKSYNLSIIKNNTKLNVPNGFVITSHLFKNFIEENELNTEIGKYLEGMNFSEIHLFQEKIKKSSFTCKFIEEIDEACSNLKGRTLAVRSSFSFEDTKNKSYAGMFSSTTDVENKNQLFNAIKDTWISAFNPLVERQCFNTLGIGVLVQNYVDCIMSGVAFSEDYEDKSQLLICFNEGSPEDLTAGVSSGQNVKINRDKDNIGSELLVQVKKATLQLEKLFNYPVDVEWAFDRNGKLFILQCREICEMKNEKTVMFADVDSIEELRGFNLDGCVDRHKKWYVKKHWVRIASKDAGIATSSAKYIRLGKDNVDRSELEGIKDLFRTKWIEIVDDYSRSKMPREDICEFLLSGKLSNMIRVEEVTPTLISGISTFNKDTGHCYIEFVPGGINGVRDGQMDPSVIIFKDKIIFSDVKKYNSYLKFDENKCTWCTQVMEEFVSPNIHENSIREIYRLTKTMYDKFGETRVEWIFDGEKIHCFDLSIEYKAIEIPDNGDTVKMSPGSITAPIYFLKDVSVLDNIFEDHVSVWRSSDFFDTQRSINLGEILVGYKGNIPPIIVCEYPLTKLALLSKHVAGFIFERGSMLCHLSIILREEGIPAVVIPEATKKFIEGSLVSIN